MRDRRPFQSGTSPGASDANHVVFLLALLAARVHESVVAFHGGRSHTFGPEGRRQTHQQGAALAYRIVFPNTLREN